MKVTVVGAGNAGSFTALHWSWYTRNDPNVQIELVYDPSLPPERVGQATLLDAPHLLWGSTGFDWYNNNIHATFKSGILYEGWGKTKDKFFHNFPADRMAMHYCPWEMQQSILNSGHFKVTESDSIELEDIDSDYIFDCRGKPDNFDDYYDLLNPINSVILGRPNWDMSNVFWSRHVATPDGWTFVIPTHPDSPSYDYCVGYCYNNSITTKEEAEQNFLSLFDVNVTKHSSFKNYIAKSPVVDERTFLNGNRLFFLEPLESSSTQTYLHWAKILFGSIFLDECDIRQAEEDIIRYIRQTQNFVLWHYHFGSKYDTPFWEYAKTLKFIDEEFDDILQYSRSCSKYEIIPESHGGGTINHLYSQWPPYSFKVWDEGVNG